MSGMHAMLTSSIHNQPSTVSFFLFEIVTRYFPNGIHCCDVTAAGWCHHQLLLLLLLICDKKNGLKLLVVVISTTSSRDIHSKASKAK